MTGSGLPRWSSWLLAAALPRAMREPVIGDLAESFTERARQEGSAAARDWLRVETWRLVRTIGLYRDDRVPLTPPRPPLHGMMTDIRFALRLFAHRPTFVLVALFTLALGIGANTAIFSVVKPILLDGLPYPEGDRLVSVFERDLDGSSDFIGYPTFTDLQRETRSLDRLAVVGYWMPTLMGRGESEQLTGQKVTAGFFSMLGLKPALGRDFSPDDDRPGVQRVALLSYALWRDRFGADPAVVGLAISLDGYPFEVVGVLPPDFESVLEPAATIWTPLRYDATLPYACRTCRHLRPIGRLAPGGDAVKAEAELTSIANRLAAAYPDEYPAKGMVVRPLQKDLTKSARTPLWALFGAVGLLLLLACVNVANLLLGQASQRSHEFSLRLALGAARGRLVRQVLIESALLGLGGAALGLGLAAVVTHTVRIAGPDSLPRLQSIGLDWTVLLFAAAIGIAGGVGFGIGPALWATRQADRSWRAAGRIAGGRRRHAARNGLVVAEVALALMLVTGAGLLLKSMGRLLGVDPGFESNRLVTMAIVPAGRKFDNTEVALAYYRRVADAVSGTPAVRAAALVSQLPLGGNLDSYGIRIASKPDVPDPQVPSADRYAVMGPYFAAMNIPLVKGRVFSDADRAGSMPVVIVNATMARLDWPARDPVGDRVQLGGKTTPWRTIVGVVGDVHHAGLDQPVTRQLYLPEDQWMFGDAMTVVARTTLPPDRVAPSIRQAIRALDPDPTVTQVASMESVIARSTAARRFVMVLFEGFAAVALLLAAAGVYGVMASGVTERFKEFGIRSALGASRRALLGQVIFEAVRLGAVGIALGSLAAFALSRLGNSLLFDVSPADPQIYVGAALILGTIAVLAAWAPARRASRLDPTVTLRAE